MFLLWFDSVIVLLFGMLYILIVVFFFFFFNQKTAYEMRISDWSSDVCSSDLTKSVQCSVFSVQCSVFSVQCSVFSVQCSVFSGQWVVRSDERRVGKECVSTCRYQR